MYILKKYYPKDMWIAMYDGETIVFKATQDRMEQLFRDDPKMSDYKMLAVYKIPEKKGDAV